MPCNSRTSFRTVYKVEGREMMLAAAARLGWGARVVGETITVQSPRGAIVVRPGATEAAWGAQVEASALMVEYAKVCGEKMIGEYPDLYEEVGRDAGSVTYNVKVR